MSVLVRALGGRAMEVKMAWAGIGSVGLMMMEWARMAVMGTLG